MCLRCRMCKVPDARAWRRRAPCTLGTPGTLGTLGTLRATLLRFNFFMSVARRTRPLERFWPYAEHPEEPTVEELAALDPDLHAALFGPRDLAFSITVVFGRFDGPEYDEAVAMARESAEYREVGSGETFRHRARFFRKMRSACARCSSAWPPTSGPRC